MKKLDLNTVAGEFEMISDEHQLFYNRDTGEFEFYIDPIYSGIEDDFEKFEEDCWIACPDQRELREYDIMTDFAETITDPRVIYLSETGDLLQVAANLFAALHAMEENPSVAEIYVQPVPETGIGVAIMDRLKKAAYQYL